MDDTILCRPCLIRGKHVQAINYIETPSVPFWPLCEKHSNVVRRAVYGPINPISLIPPEAHAKLKMIR